MTSLEKSNSENRVDCKSKNEATAGFPSTLEADEPAEANTAPDQTPNYLSQAPPALHKTPFSATPVADQGNIPFERQMKTTFSPDFCSSKGSDNKASLPNIGRHTSSQPIRIPSLAATPQDLDRVHTSVSGEGDRKGHLFPFTRSPSPRGRQGHFSAGNHHIEETSESTTNSLSRQRSSSSHLSRYHLTFTMHPGDQLSSRYTPTSPLSPRMVSDARPISPQPSRRANHSRQTSRNLKVKLPRYHPAHFQSTLEIPTSSSSSQNSAVTHQRLAPGQMESPRLMRERQREFIDRARMSSRIAASPMGIKPDRPRLDPLGSPKGNVTPLALEEAQDYFQVAGAGRVSPAQSPGAVSAILANDMAEVQNKKSPRSEYFRLGS